MSGCGLWCVLGGLDPCHVSVLLVVGWGCGGGVSVLGRMVDALVAGADEGRGNLR